MNYYEKALDYWPNHGSAIVGLSNILLDMYEGKIPREPQDNQELLGAQSTNTEEAIDTQRTSSLVSSMANSALGVSQISSAMSRSQTMNSIHQDATSTNSQTNRIRKEEADSDDEVDGSGTGGAAGAATAQNGNATSGANSNEDATPEELDQLAARDRAYSLLSTLTKLGAGWDCSEAWIGLARAYEASGQIEKAKEVLWWCVELEDSRPLRGWQVVGFL
jgi:cargo-transport protein YPP1